MASLKDRHTEDPAPTPAAEGDLGAPVPGQVARARALENLLLADEYAGIERALRDERVRRRLAVRQLLALERRTTDDVLAAARSAADPQPVAAESLGTIVHDLRSMLSAVTLSAGAIVIGASRGQPAELLVELGSNIQRAAAQMELLLADLQDLAALDAGRTNIVLANHDFIQVVRTAVEIHQPAATANGIALSASLPAAPIHVSIDAARFARVISNLLANAIKFTPHGGSVTVEVAQIGNVVEASVTDTGPGIQAALHDSIFERFCQGPNGAGAGRGVGLGLYIARSIVVAHGGRIWVESVPGQGATFRVRLPIN
jgi:signal transduction histidine kinase